MSALAQLYARSVQKGDRKLEDIPAVIRPKVKAIVEPQTKQR